MNNYTKIGVVGLAATFVAHSALPLVFPDMFPAIFSAPWWYQVLGYSPVWLVFLVVGLATGRDKDGNGGAKENTKDE